MFWLSLILISFFAYNKEKSLQEAIIFLRYLIIPICCYFLFFKDQKYLNYLLLLVLILVFLVSIDTLFQFFNYSSEDGFGKDLLGFKSNWYGRLTGPFGDELIPGSYVSKFGLVGFTYLLINKKLNKHNIYKILYLALILVVCFASGERMALSTFSLSLFILLIFLYNHRSTILTAIILGTVIILFIYVTHPFYNDYKIIESTQFHQGLIVEKQFNCESDQNKICTKVINIQPSFFEIVKNFSTSAYGEIFRLSFEMFKSNPITGIGLNNFQELCLNNDIYREMIVNYDCASHPHNTYIQWLTEGGLIVFCIFIFYLGMIINLIIKNDGGQEYKIIALVLMLILFWPIMSTGSLIKNWYGVSVFFVIATSLCISNIKKDYKI